MNSEKIAHFIDWRAKPMKRFTLLALLLTASTPGLSQQQSPTVTELFALRSACAQLGQKLSDQYGYGADWTRSETLSRYDPGAGHCYVEMDDQGIAEEVAGEFHRYLYDAQTDDLLATTETIKGKAVSGIVYDPQHKSSENNNYDDASSYI